MITKKLEILQRSSTGRLTNGQKVCLIQLRYPYGKNQTYMSGSITVTGARLLSAGYDVAFIDLNFHTLEDIRTLEILAHVDYIGISVTGSPSIPGARICALFLRHRFPEKHILIGGRVIEKLSHEQFSRIFESSYATQVTEDERELTGVLDRRTSLPAPYDIEYAPCWKHMDQEILKAYLSCEMTLVISQGCKYACSYCAAANKQKEKHIRFDHLRNDLYYLAGRAQQFGLDTLEFYASSLDFFQHPEIIIGHLNVLAEVREITGIRIKVRCLTCTSSFLRACDEIENFSELIHRSGLWCIGFGVDGADVGVWKHQKKFQNKEHAFEKCISLCELLGVRVEMLMVIGFPQDTFQTLFRAIKSSLIAAYMYHHVVVRPYLAKQHVPGNEEWSDPKDSHRIIERLIKNPNLFFHLDFCALGSRITHPRFFHRVLSNIAYLLIIVLLTPFGKCLTSPLLPQGNGGIGEWIAKKINKMMPFDH